VPPISKEQWSKFPSSLMIGLRKVTFAILPPETGPSMGPHDRMIADLAFLGFPRKSPETQGEHVYRVQGWYHSALPLDWPKVDVNAGGQMRSEPLARSISPDVASVSGVAPDQRFDFYTTCKGSCSLTFTTKKAVFSSLDLVEMVDRQTQQAIGDEKLIVDSVTTQMDSSDTPDMRTKLSIAIQAKDMLLYGHVMKWLAWLAVVTMLFVLIHSLVSRHFTATRALAVAIWILLSSRLLLLSLIDISAFPAMIVPYLAPAYVLMSVAIIASFASIKNTSKPMILESSSSPGL